MLLDFTGELPYLRPRPFTDYKLDKLPHVFIRSDTNWDPTVYANNINDSTTLYDAAANEGTPLKNPNFDQTGNYRHRTVATHSMYEQLHYFDTNSFEPPD